LVTAQLKANGMAMKQGTIIDATLIAAPSSTKNKAGERDPEMHQTKKGNQWYFGMKVHIGVDSESGLIHSVETTAANVHDLTPAADLLHGEETVVYADAGYQGIDKRTEMEGRAGPIRSHPEGCPTSGSRHPTSLSRPLMSCARAAMPSVIDQIPSSRRALIARLRSVARI